jgi:amino acid adenylation domain-containing protein
MSHRSSPRAELPREQQSILSKCFHPAGTPIEFQKAEVEQSVPDRFEQQVLRYPNRLAVKTSSHELTYAELNHAANRVAWAILGQRSRSEEPIALLLDTDAPMIAAILGALKAGKTYVPLDPALPRTRSAHIVDDSRAGLLVTDTHNLPAAKELTRDKLPLLNIDELDAGSPSDNPGLSTSPDTLAWIIYTSGSTGQPKGVIQSHRNALHFTMNYTNYFHICADDRLSLLFSASVHAGAFGTFAALLNGACLYPLNLRGEGLGRLARWLSQEGITIYSSVPTVFRHFVSTLTRTEQFPDLRLIYLAGEAVTKRDVDLYKKHFAAGCIFINRLGSTEVDCISLYFVDQETQIDGSLVPVGYAVEDKEIQLRNDDGNAVVFNEVGEIVVKSRYISPGYWRRPDLTHAAFLPDAEGGGGRLYRTGDLGCLRPDGCLMYLGRRDFQVKIRGYRIETAEIEMALRDLAMVKEATITTRADPSGDPELVAYLVPSEQPSPTITTLRRALIEVLPAYMIPSRFVFLNALPLAPNGKVDRRALPAAGQVRPPLEVAYAAPRTPTERVLAEIWGEVLGWEHVGVHDHFLDLGGHSLLATQVMARIQNVFHVDLPVSHLFEAATVDELADVIEQAKSGGVGLRAPAIAPASRSLTSTETPLQKGSIGS